MKRRCKEAIPSKEKGGKVMIIDMMVENKKEDDESVETQLFFDMLMMILVTGKERTEKEWAKLFLKLVSVNTRLPLFLTYEMIKKAST
ncbi:unnamed protein product [Thlaspi arvense]|uniref:O-methyltransferase C-terminal domain-containing protein n=1 Tax=Thlaspi arvense TaxID=13288 RepID=A0AAU9RI28_THLAR|nr:unnamed protein product [Thlaspi arvense]